jgi:uncharacterized protein
MNPLTGAMDVVDKRGANLLQNPDAIGALEEFSDFFAAAKAKGYVYDTAEDEQRALSSVGEKVRAAHKSEPLRIDIYPTFLCNLRCTYCFQPHLFHGRNNLIQAEAIDALFDAVEELQRMWGSPATPVLTLFGGEPLLNRPGQRNAVARILSMSTARGYRLKVITNGVELSSYAALLANHKLEFVQVTLDGPREVHDCRRIFGNGGGTFDRIAEGIDAALENGLPVAIRVNADAENIVHLPRLADYILDKGWVTKGVTVCVAPVEDFVPETEYCAESTTLETLRRLLDVKRKYAQTAFMAISSRSAQFFDYVLEHGCLPLPMTKYCAAVIGNQISLDYQGNIFACC